MPEPSPPRRDRRVVALLVILPAWLILSSGIGLWMWYRAETSEEIIEPTKFTTPVDAGRLEDDLKKLVDVIGQRGASTPEGGRGLRRAAAMIEGSMGVGNAGYRLELIGGATTPNGQWPTIVAMLPGDERTPLWLVAGYDTGLRGGVESNATGVASLMAVAQALAGKDLGRPVNFAFIPHAYEPDAPVMALLTGLVPEVEGLVLVVESMGGAGPLIVSSRDAEALGQAGFSSHATIVGAEAICLADDFDLSSLLFELGKPAVRVSTRGVVRSDEDDRRLPIPEQHAESTRNLTELVVELAK